MKTVTPTLQAAIENPLGSRPLVRVKVSKSRAFSSVLTADLAPAWATDGNTIGVTINDDGTITHADHYPQDVAYFEAPYNHLLSVSNVSQGLKLTADIDASHTFDATGITLSLYSKPAIINDNGTGYVFYDSGGTIYRAQIDLSKALGTPYNSDCLNAPVAIGTGVYGAAHALSANAMVYVFPSDGGIGVKLITNSGGSWTENLWVYRFMWPGRVCDDDWISMYSAACYGPDGKANIYLTDWTSGAVRGVQVDADGRWGDTFEAIPADLSRLFISKAFLANGYIHLVGQYERTEDLSLDVTRGFDLRSTDGRNFSFDRFSLFTNLGYRFVGTVGGDQVHYYSSNRIISLPATHFFAASPPAENILEIPMSDIINLGAEAAEQNGSVSLVLKNGNEYYTTNALVKRGNRATVEIGYQTSIGAEYVPYMTCIITAIESDFADTRRGLRLGLVPEGVWATNLHTYPFYVEITGRSALRDECSNTENFYVATNSAYSALATVSVDFWNAKAFTAADVAVGSDFQAGSGATPLVIIGDHSAGVGVETEQFKTQLGLVDHPEITGDVTARVYGWSRTIYTNGANDSFEIRLRTFDPVAKTESIVTGVLASVTGQPPQSYLDVIAGDYPVEYTFTGLTNGHQILSAVVVVRSVLGTVVFLERVELTAGFTATDLAADGNTGWQENEATETIPASTRLVVPGSNRPYIMFATKPFSAYNFYVSGKFSYDPGVTPNTLGETVWGLVGHAEDALNYTACRYNKQLGRFELVLARNGVETVLATATHATIPDGFGFRHIDGVFYLSILTGTTWDVYPWDAPVSNRAYQWEEVNGPLATSEDLIMHVGIYGAKFSPHFRITSFNFGTCAGIMPLPGEDMTVFDGLPASGYISVDGVTYHYSSKTVPASITPRGPYQGRNTYIGSANGWEITFFDWAADENAFSGYAIGSNNGHNHVIGGTLWKVQHDLRDQHPPDNDSYLRNRSRHFSDTISGNQIGLRNRMYIGPALLVDEVASGEPTNHGWRSVANVDSSDIIYLDEFSAVSGDQDQTLKDILTKLCAFSGSGSSFPGDYTGDVTITAGGRVSLL